MSVCDTAYLEAVPIALLETTVPSEDLQTPKCICIDRAVDAKWKSVMVMKQEASGRQELFKSPIHVYG